MLLTWDRNRVIYDIIYTKIYACLHGPEGTRRGWLYQHLDDHRANPEQGYIDHFAQLCSNINNPDKQHVIQSRLSFVDADLHGQQMQLYFAQRNGATTSYDNVAYSILWASRGAATRTTDINDHISRSDFISHPVLMLLANTKTIERWVDERIRQKRCVQIGNTQDRRKKWLSLAVPSLMNMWCERLTWFLVRMIVVDREETPGMEGNRRLWVDDLFMPEEIFDIALRKRDELDCFKLR